MLFTLDLTAAESAANATVGTGRDHTVIGHTLLDDTVLGQRGGGTGLHTGAAGYAVGVHEPLVLTGADPGIKSAAVDSQREGPLHLIASSHAARADDALRGVELEIRIAGVNRRIKMITAVEAIAHFAQSDRARHVLEFAVAVGGTGQAVERVVGNIEFHDIASQLRQLVSLRADLHALLDECRARGRIALAAFDFDRLNVDALLVDVKPPDKTYGV